MHITAQNLKAKIAAAFGMADHLKADLTNWIDSVEERLFSVQPGTMAEPVQGQGEQNMTDSAAEPSSDPNTGTDPNASQEPAQQ